VFRARLVACGYSQIPGIDFNESFAPVVNDVSFRIMLIAKLIWNLQAIIVDVETAFLHGDLKEEIYMNVPEGLQHDSNSCLLLKKTI
jgi:Reverse transcriptase (RNA-dependent DNA polymerase)